MGIFSFMKSALSRTGASENQIQLNEIERLDDGFPDPFHPFSEPVSIPISDVFDLHTIPPPEVKQVVEEYLHEAERIGLRTVRIIHGKGIGVQKQMVRSILARTPFVLDWTDAPPEAGGLGATIVRFRETGLTTS